MRKVRTYFLPFLVIALVLALTCTAFQLGTKQYVHSRVEAEVGTHLQKLEPGTLGVGQLYDQYVFDIEPEHEFYIRIQGEGFGLGDILFLSKMDARFASSAWEKVDIRELLCDLLRGMEESAAQRNIRTGIMGAEEPVFVMGNEAQLEMAIGNILSNALRFAKDEIRVEITTEKKQVRVDIFNNGQEISQEDMPHIFERFYKGANGGHGIGLAIAKEVVEAHKGKITVRNENGVCFTIRLKRAR